MSGIYFHIPFCHKKCNYCDFFSVISNQFIDRVVQTEIIELVLRKSYLESDIVESIYFGGGTPSVLPINSLKDILKALYDNFVVSSDCEITLEANPEDLSFDYLKKIFDIGINRLSIGIQSYSNDILKFLGRNHTNLNINHIVENAKKIGFVNLSADLIFGLYGFPLNSYIESLKRIGEMDFQHISAYGLSIEKGTQFYRHLKQGRMKEINEEDFIQQFEFTMDYLKSVNFFHYEISSFAKEGFISKHNSSYWNRTKYLGIGPSAHSFNISSRQWNVSSIIKYINSISNSQSYYKLEFLTDTDKYNEYILTGLRTSKGINSNFILKSFDCEIYSYFINKLKCLPMKDCVDIFENNLVLNRKGILVSDYIINYFSL